MARIYSRSLWFVGALFGLGLNLVAAGLQGAIAGPNDFNRVVTFGDSLSDNGNLFASLGTPASPPYFQGRFSNGPVWLEQLFGPMNSPFQGTGVGGNTNLAFGGARADANPNPLGPIPGVPAQIAAFQSFGGAIGPNDLVTVWAGANDLFQVFPPFAIPTEALITTTAINTAGDQITNVKTLIGLGARTLLVPNLPNIGAAPAFNTTASGQSGGFLAASTYNEALAQGLKQVAAGAPGVNIVQMNVAAALGVIIDNASAFGFTNVTNQCLTTPTCVAAPLATQNTFLFWDGVHPTQAGHALLALYASLLLSTDETSKVLAPLAESGLFSRMQASDAIFDRLTAWLTGSYAHQNGLYAEVVGASSNFDAHGTRGAYDFHNYGVRGGIDRQFDNVLIGGALTVLNGDIGGSPLSSDTMTFQGDLYASVFMGPLFLNVEAGLSETQLNNIERQTGFGPVKAEGESQAHQYGAAVEAGLLLNMGSLAVLPSARVGYASSNMDGYAESAPILAMSYTDRETSASFWGAKVRVSSPLDFGSILSTAYVEGGFEDFFSVSNDNINAQLVNNTALPVSVLVEDPVSRGAFLKLGINGRITETVKFDVDYGLSFQEGDGETHTGKVRIKIPMEWAAAQLK